MPLTEGSELTSSHSVQRSRRAGTPLTTWTRDAKAVASLVKVPLWRTSCIHVKNRSPARSTPVRSQIPFEDGLPRSGVAMMAERSSLDVSLTSRTKKLTYPAPVVARQHPDSSAVTSSPSSSSPSPSPSPATSYARAISWSGLSLPSTGAAALREMTGRVTVQTLSMRVNNR